MQRAPWLGENAFFLREQMHGNLAFGDFALEHWQIWPNETFPVTQNAVETSYLSAINMAAWSPYFTVYRFFFSFCFFLGMEGALIKPKYALGSYLPNGSWWAHDEENTINSFRSVMSGVMNILLASAWYLKIFRFTELKLVHFSHKKHFFFHHSLSRTD